MKKIFLGMAFAIGALFLSNAANAQKMITLKLNKSTIEWSGKKVTGAHNGSIMLKSGELMMKNSKITGGQFVMDMNSIKNLDIESDKYRKNLEKHLKSGDFFGVKKFPEAKFMIKGSEILKNGKLLVKGDLSIKGITKSLGFEVDIHKHGESYHMSGLMQIDRTQFNIKYGSGSFFDNLGDRAIHNNFELKFDLMF